MKKTILLTLVLATLSFSSIYGQCTTSQLGADIDGEAAVDGSGSAVSFSSDSLTMAIGAFGNDGNGSNSGHVRVYKYISGTWTQHGADIDGEAAADQSGWSVSLSADGLTVAIGARYYTGNGSNSGHVRIYKIISGTWTQQGADIDGEAAYDQSGYSISLSADGLTVAIGAAINDGNGANAGHVRIYKIISGTWIQQGADIDGEAAGDQSGASVSLSADGLTVAIGAFDNDGNGLNSGHVRIYKNISGTWTQQGADIDGEAAGDNFGYSVSLSEDGSIVAIGARYNDGNGANAGHVRIYKIISGTWTQQGADIDGEAANDGSGYSVSLSADGLTVAIGARYNDGNGANAGHVRIYKIISGTWIQQGIDIDGEAVDDQSGEVVSLSADGLTIAIGARSNDGNGSFSGHVRVYELDCPIPEINLKGNNVDILDGDNSPSLADSTDFGSTATSIVNTYKIFNTGTAVLNISSILSSGTNASDFVVSGAPSSIVAGGSGSFIITFTPGALGVRTATITINNDDADEAVYDFAIEGTGISSAGGNCTFSQLGLDLDGEAVSDGSGHSVSLSADGLTVAIGAPTNDGNGIDAGQVRVYKKISGTWTQQGADIDGEAAGDNMGWSVSLSSDGLTVAIGAIRNDGNGIDAGHVRVYKNISGTWTQQGADIDGEAAYDNSGHSVSLSADGLILAIGALNNDGNGIKSGQVRVYKNISGTWTQQGADIDGEAAFDYSASSISLSTDGLTVAIGAIGNDGNGSTSGHVRVYKNVSGTWTQQGADIDGEAASDQSGHFVSLSADGLTVAIGAPRNDGNGSDAGHIRVYKNISGTWTQQGADIDGEAAGDRSGNSLSLSADGLTVAIGAFYNAGNGAYSGQVRVYKNVSGTWSQQGVDVDGEAAGDQSGRSVSLSADGLTVAIGANTNDGNGGSSGHVRVFELNCPCNLSSPLTTTAATYVSTNAALDGSWLCFCDASYNLLLALDTTGTGAIIPETGVQLQVGIDPTTSWISAGGLITNQYGGAIFNRKWDVAPSIQPSSSVKVRYFFTEVEYQAIKDTMANHNGGAANYPTTVNAVTDLEMYKLNGGLAFGDPHASGAVGVLLHNGASPSTTEWVHSTHGTTDHVAEFKVTSLSGGGGGIGGGAAALPIELLHFSATMQVDNSVYLNWSTVSEINNSHFEIQRSYDGVEFNTIRRAEGTNTNKLTSYLLIDLNYDPAKTVIYYRIKQVDYNGQISFTELRTIDIKLRSVTALISVSPNPSNGNIQLAWTVGSTKEMKVSVHDLQGKQVFVQTLTASEGYQVKQINLSHLNSGVYILSSYAGQQVQQVKLMIK